MRFVRLVDVSVGLCDF